MKMCSLVPRSQRWSVTEAAIALGVHKNTVARWIDTGLNGQRLRCFRVGHKRFVLPDDLERFLSEPAGTDGDEGGAA